MKIKMVRCCVGGGIAMSLAFLAVLPTIAYTGQKLAKEAKISMSQAQSIAFEGASGQDHG
jgi:hypothetical protein